MPKLDHEMFRDYFGGNLWRSDFFGSGPGFVNRTQSDPGFVNPIRSDPIRSWFCQSNPIRSGPDFVNAHKTTAVYLTLNIK